MTIYHVFEAIFVLDFVKLIPVEVYSIFDVFLRRFLRRVYDDIPMVLDTFVHLLRLRWRGGLARRTVFLLHRLHRICDGFRKRFLRSFSTVFLGGSSSIFTSSESSDAAGEWE